MTTFAMSPADVASWNPTTRLEVATRPVDTTPVKVTWAWCDYCDGEGTDPVSGYCGDENCERQCGELTDCPGCRGLHIGFAGPATAVEIARALLADFWAQAGWMTAEADEVAISALCEQATLLALAKGATR